MKSLETKQEILELKLSLVKVQMERRVLIKEQQYEKAADNRDQEQVVKEKLDEIKARLLQELEKLKIAPASLEETYSLLNLLSEFNHDETHKTFASIRMAFMERLKLEYEELWNDRKRLHRELKLTEAHQLHDQILEIGRYLVKYGG